ncbi:hypothetical protein B0H11DRAFT_476529 [Mycena galericulata]|nr:hypothetical protein B0H11DRAFT_476529 [Mycena galericulata]
MQLAKSSIRKVPSMLLPHSSESRRTSLSTVVRFRRHARRRDSAIARLLLRRNTTHTSPSFRICIRRARVQRAGPIAALVSRKPRFLRVEEGTPASVLALPIPRLCTPSEWKTIRRPRDDPPSPSPSPLHTPAHCPPAACAIGILAYLPLPPHLVLFAPAGLGGEAEERGNSLCWMDIRALIRGRDAFATKPPVCDSMYFVSASLNSSGMQLQGSGVHRSYSACCRLYSHFPRQTSKPTESDFSFFLSFVSFNRRCRGRTVTFFLSFFLPSYITGGGSGNEDR